MSTNNTAVKAYTIRPGTLWYTNDATAVTAVSIPTRQRHIYTVKVSGMVYDVLGQTAMFFERIASYMNIYDPTEPDDSLLQIGTTANIYTAGGSGYTLDLDMLNNLIRVRIKGAIGHNLTWKIAVDVMESGAHAPNGGWIHT